MKRYLLMLAALWVAWAQVAAQGVQGVKADSVHMVRNGSYMAVDMSLDLSNLSVENNRAVLLTPRLVKGNHSADLPSVGIYGRQRYYYYVRNGESMLTGHTETVLRASRQPDRQPYQALIPYEAWMDGSQLQLHRQDYGCCSTVLAEADDTLIDRWTDGKQTYMPALAYLRPQAEAVKSRSLQGSAYIDFPVNQTVIRPDYRNNRVELAKIQATIDSVRNDTVIRITALSIKSFASPEGSYQSNARLAEGRTQALKQYVMGLYDFPASFIATSYEPENWEGLRAYVAQCTLPHRQEILALIDSNREPDNKEWKIKSEYPDDYRSLLADCYPALRRSDYRVEYVIRRFTDVEECKRVLQTQPQKLSLEEFYLVAQTLEPGSEAYNEVFETAVRMYPSDPVANLNAANTALVRGDLKRAAHYLEKAGDSPQALYARGVHVLLSGNRGTARELLQQASQAGVTEAAQTLKDMETL